MFFDQKREQFFRPLTSKYREQIVDALKELYRRLYASSSADYGHALNRDDVIDTFSAALERSPVLSSGDDEFDGRFRTNREKSNWILSMLLDHGWLEKQVDEANLQSSFNFSRMGRTFTEPFVQNDMSSIRTRHRNTRNVRNAINSFFESGEVYDLLDAWEYSESIISDFTDIIAELDERKRSLVREMETHAMIAQATEDFFDFMERRFQPDLAIRLSADNVEKYRDHIVEIIHNIRNKNKTFKQNAEKRLRELLPELVQENQSVLWLILDSIETRLQAASDIMLPALRKALQGFTKRADLIIRQMNYLSSSSHNDMVQVCQQFVEKSDSEQSALLDRASQLMSVPQLGYLDPSTIRLHNKRVRREFSLDVVEDQIGDFDQSARKELVVQQWLDQAFLINDNQVRQYLISHLTRGESVRTSDLPVKSADELLSLSHAIEVGSANSFSSEFKFNVKYIHQDPVHSEYFTSQDLFEISLTHDAENSLEEANLVSGN
ncbi:Wadjet anti-phage system protein JetA family protein [Reinekea marina]|uniref:Wadjet anti-phage system protein JetA family protein n=2 Tax=Reinekea marina TaxID=1310421 RepID=A0ABV7WMA4_9GAMM|nr:flagellar protein FliT [Reinekea forsetii]